MGEISEILGTCGGGALGGVAVGLLAPVVFGGKAGFTIGSKIRARKEKKYGKNYFEDSEDPSMFNFSPDEFCLGSLGILVGTGVEVVLLASGVGFVVLPIAGVIGAVASAGDMCYSVYCNE